MKKNSENKNIFIEAPTIYGERQLVNIANIQNIRSMRDDKNEKEITFIYFDGPGTYCKTSDTIDQIKKKIEEAQR